MDVKKLVLLIGALIVAAVTAVTAKNMFSGAGAPAASATPAVPAGPEVLVATRALPIGTIIDAEAFRFQRWPEGLVQPAYYIKGKPGVRPADLVGTVVRNEITAGQPFTQGSLIKPGERGFLAAALGPGMRAVTVAVSATSGVAGFVFPGDRVDIVLTQDVTGGGEGAPLKVSETVMRNVRVLATDQRMDAKGEDGKAVVQRFTMVTLEATPKLAEKIAVAQRIGDLSLSLRSIADNSAELERAIASGEVKVPQTDDPKAERQMLLAVANRPSEGLSTYTTGSDVSRFQRSTVPGDGKGKGQASSPDDKIADALTAMALASSGRAPAGAAAAPSTSTGPSVRVARGNSVTIVPVGAK
jgi:pilus assembly protein CpaB